MKVDILGVLVDNLTFAQVLDKVEDFVNAGRPHYIVTPYSESIVAARKDTGFREILNRADLAVPDGIGLLLAAKYLREVAKLSSEVASDRENDSRWCHDALPRGRLGNLLKLLFLGVKAGFSIIFPRRFLDVIPEEVKGTDLMLALCERAARKGWRVFLLGGWNGVAEQLAQKLKKQYNNLTIEAMEGSRDVKEETLDDWGEVKGKLSQFQPDLLFVAYGPVRQEKWIARCLPELSSKVVVGVAGAFDILSGRKPRASLFLRRLGLEWLWRLIIEPARLPRIWRAVIVFPWLVFCHALEKRGGRGGIWRVGQAH